MGPYTRVQVQSCVKLGCGGRTFLEEGGGATVEGGGATEEGGGATEEGGGAILFLLSSCPPAKHIIAIAANWETDSPGPDTPGTISKNLARRNLNQKSKICQPFGQWQRWIRLIKKMEVKNLELQLPLLIL